MTFGRRPLGPAIGDSIEVRARALAAMVDHARRDAPLECCGLVLGETGRIDESVGVRNARASEKAYLIDPAEHLAVLKRARAEGRAVLGAYHSHPRSPAVPSPTDLAEAHYEEFLYVIVSLADPASPDVRGYRLSGRHFVPVTLVAVENPR
jgi:[CysO sulfur-carrier protein]-S-L-cysteine hydrolase